MWGMLVKDENIFRTGSRGWSSRIRRVIEAGQVGQGQIAGLDKVEK
jgi:hypothetical protein